MSNAASITFNTYRWILAWLIMIVLLSVLNKTRMGHVIIYWSLALTLLLLVATQYRFISGALSPLGTRVSSIDATPSGQPYVPINPQGV